MEYQAKNPLQDSSIILALDGMGGDHAPQSVIEGAIIALKSGVSVRFHVYGNQDVLREVLKAHPHEASQFDIIHTEEVITNDVKPASVLRGYRDSSMRRAVEAVAKGTASAVVSSGNTGAYMALSRMLLKMDPNIDRPAIATTIPTVQGSTLMMDLGANLECAARNLVEFAVMGHVFAERLFLKESPTIGLLNIGSEDVKGHDELQTAAQELRKMKSINFYGFIEGDDILAGTTDVVITDGFTGNVALKTMEGTAKFIKTVLSNSLSQSLRGKFGYLLAKPAFELLQNRIDPRHYNGALFLGLRGIAVKSHGSADAIGFANAIKVAVSLCQTTAHTMEEEIAEILGG